MKMMKKNHKKKMKIVFLKEKVETNQQKISKVDSSARRPK